MKSKLFFIFCLKEKYNVVKNTRYVFAYIFYFQLKMEPCSLDSYASSFAIVARFLVGNTCCGRKGNP